MPRTTCDPACVLDARLLSSQYRIFEQGVSSFLAVCDIFGKRYRGYQELWKATETALVPLKTLKHGKFPKWILPVVGRRFTLVHRRAEQAQLELLPPPATPKKNSSKCLFSSFQRARASGREKKFEKKFEEKKTVKNLKKTRTKEGKKKTSVTVSRSTVRPWRGRCCGARSRSRRRATRGLELSLKGAHGQG